MANTLLKSRVPVSGVLTRRGGSVVTPDPIVTNRFAGDPGVGKYYYGGREDTLTTGPGAYGWSSSETAIANWESFMSPWSGGKKLGIIRLYASGSTTTGFTLGSDITRHHSNGRMVHISFKFPTTGNWGTSLSSQMNTAILFGTDWNAWMDALATRFLFYAPKPIWWTFFHEPEDFTDSPAIDPQGVNYRAICRRMVQDLKARGVTNAAYANGCIQAPFDYGAAGGTRDWRWYYADWKGTSLGTKDNPNINDFYVGDQSVVDMIGLDVYSWWNAATYAGQEGNNADGTPKAATATESVAKYETFPVLFDRMKVRNDLLGKPYLIGEYGVEAYHTGIWYPPEDGRTSTAVFDDSLTLAHMQSIFDSLPSFNIVGLEVYNYALTHQPWRLEWGDTNRARYHGYGLGIARPECVRAADVGITL